MNFSVTQQGQPLDPSKYTWDENTKTFSTNETNLVLDFSGWTKVTFKTGYNCTFKTGSYCTFTTGSLCTFTTHNGCTFTTGEYCTFTTGRYCTFTTGSLCTFTTGRYCTFTTGSLCTFKTGDSCTFKTGDSCTFTTGSDCTFKTGEQSIVIRRDVFEVIQLEKGKTIKLNVYKVAGFTYINEKHIISIDGKEHKICTRTLRKT